CITGRSTISMVLAMRLTSLVEHICGMPWTLRCSSGRFWFRPQQLPDVSWNKTRGSPLTLQ
ncbi:MAG: hypothetical protein ACKPJJ_08340, partial [Planctomycetaceae bacterium]